MIAAVVRVLDERMTIKHAGSTIITLRELLSAVALSLAAAESNAPPITIAIGAASVQLYNDDGGDG